MAAAKRSDDLAAEALPYTDAKALKVLAATPPSMVRLAYLRDQDFELQLPAQHPPTCLYLGQPKDDGRFAHASVEWSFPPRGLLRTKVAFEWRAQRGKQTIVLPAGAPPDFEAVKKSQQVAIPDRLLTAKRLVDIFERICGKSLAKLSKRKPPHTLVSCRLLGAPKGWAVEQEDVRFLGMADGGSVEHLIIARIKDDVYVCCTDANAWAAARQGKLTLKHFVIRDLAAGFAPRGKRAQAACRVEPLLRKLVAGEEEATAAIVATGRLVASCASIERWGWEGQALFKPDGFEPDPWLWPYAPQSARPLVWALWTTIPAGGNWQGKPKRFLSATSVHMVLERGAFPVPKDLKRSPLAPLMGYRHPLYSDRISLSLIHI